MNCIAHQAPLPMEFSRQEYWSELLLPPLRDLPDPGMEPRLTNQEEKKVSVAMRTDIIHLRNYKEILLQSLQLLLKNSHLHIQTPPKHNRNKEFLRGREKRSFWHTVPIFLIIKISLTASSFHLTQMRLAFHRTGWVNAYQKNCQEVPCKTAFSNL